jgi:hypothetical protein
MDITRSGYLKEMGIDVWIPRSAIAPQVVVAVESAIQSMNGLTEMSAQAPDRDVETAAVVQTKTSSIGAPLPVFMLALLHYETVGLCLSLGAESELPRRFCDDVARTMGGNIESLRYQLLKWPMLSTSGIDQSINAAREVVTQKFRRMPSKVLVFGDDVGDYYNPLRDLASMSIGAVGAQTFIKVPSLTEILGSGSSKRELMLAMHHWHRSEVL